MDSLSQIVLGAAVGEVVLGKKIGNRAMLWGAIAGTIPDLDIISNLWLNEVDGLAAHRGISHSLAFAVLGAVGFGWAVDKMYNSSFQKHIAIFSRSILIFSLIVGLIYFGVNSEKLLSPLIGAAAIGVLGYLWMNKRYRTHPIASPNATMRDWILLFFWGLITHPILDCFTVYGTQLFAPFSKTRVAWSTISVADPLYTVPFMICLILASFIAKEKRLRRIINWIGIGVSCSYLLFTVINKQKINAIFTQSLNEQGYVYSDLMTSPTILNNILWHGAAKTDTSIIFGKYSYFDTDKKITFYEVPMGDENLAGIENHRTIEILKWFSDGYYNVITRGDIIQFNDMRYGRFTDDDTSPDNYIFMFNLKRLGANDVEMLKSQGGPPPGNEAEIFKALIKRIRGIE